MGYTIGVDVGGTKIAAGLVDDEGSIIASVRYPSPATEVARVIETIATAVQHLTRPETPATAVGIGAAGFVDAERANVIFAPNLAWRNEPLKQGIEHLTSLPTVVENDANAAAWGEARFGAARDARSAVVVTVGTGVGGGVILDGRLLRGRHGMAAEIGHINVVPGGRLCGCGQHGCLESYASGHALVREAHRVATETPNAAARLLELGGSGPESITGQHVTRAALEGEPAALGCFGVIGGWLGRGMADLAAVLDPDVFVLAGGVSEAGDLLLSPVIAAFEAHLTARDFRQLPEIRLATLGNDAGIIGAADLARR